VTVPNSASVEAANENWPIVRLRYVGDGHAVAEVLTRILVRRALVAEGILKPAEVRNQKRTG
jgi:hypothetical protein